MKTLLLAIVLILCSLPLYSQEVYSIQYDCFYILNTKHLENGSKKNPLMTLEVSEDSSLFYCKDYVNMWNTRDSLLKLNYSAHEIIGIEQSSYRKHKSSEFLFYDYKKQSFTNYENIIKLIKTTTKVVLPKWEMSNEQKVILGYTCQKAKTFYLGRHWEAWFTTEIPMSEGPWKLKGLPGLILEAKDKDGFFHLNASIYIKKTKT